MNAKEACDLIDSIFLQVKGSIWLPQHSFDFTSIFHLTNRGISLGKVKNFIRGFNEVIEEKLLDPSRNELSVDAMNRLKESLIHENVRFDEETVERPGIVPPKKDIVIDFELD